MTQNSERGAANAVAQQATDDESRRASPDGTASEESAGFVGGAAAFAATAEGTAHDGANSMNSDPAPNSSPAPVAGVVLEGRAHEGERACGANGAATECAPAHGEVVMRVQTDVSGIDFGSRARFAGGGRSRAALRFDDPAVSPDEPPAAGYAELVSEFLLLDRAAVESAIDRFLDQFDSIATELAGLDGSSGVLTACERRGCSGLGVGSDHSAASITGRRSRTRPSWIVRRNSRSFIGLTKFLELGLAGT